MRIDVLVLENDAEAVERSLNTIEILETHGAW